MAEAAIDRLLIVLPNWVGDVVLATPTLRAVREHLSDTRITYLMRPYVRDVLHGCGWADDEVYWPQRRMSGLVGLGQRLRRQRFGAVLLLANSFGCALLAWLTRSPRRIGYARDYRAALLTERLAVPRDDGRFRVESMLTYYARLARHLGCPQPEARVELRRDDDSDQHVQAWWTASALDGVRPVVMLNPGGRFGASKLYPAEQFAAVADGLVRAHDARIVISGGPEDAPMVQAVAAAMTQPARTLLPPDIDLRRLKSLVARADLLITNDTGARHFAIAMGTPVITLFGPTHPEWTETHFALERKIQVPIECGPCQKPVCPLGHTECMKRITPEMVQAAARELLQRPADALRA